MQCNSLFSGYQYIIELVESGEYDLTLHEERKKILSLHESELVDKINPQEILFLLCNGGLISEQDRQEIDAEQRQHGERSATFLLLIYIHRRHSDWYQRFLKILFENNRETTVE